MPDYHIVIMGSNYSRKQQDIYEAEIQAVKAEILMRPPFKQRTSQIVFHLMSGRNSLRCNYTGSVGSETLTCNVNKVISAVGSTLNNLIIILVSGKGFGGSDLDRTATVGTGNHDNSTATNNLLGGNLFQRIGALASHEAGHCILGASHVESTIMGSMTNGGANGINLTFNVAQIATINAELDAVCGGFTDVAPTIQITQPLNNATLPAGQVLVRGTASANTMLVSLIIDDVETQSAIFWDRNTLANISSGIRFFPVLSAGVHTIRLKVTNVNGVETLSNLITVTIQ